MPYIRGGEIVPRRSPWRLSIIMELFWKILNFIGDFFSTLINPDGTVKKTKGRGGGGTGRWGGDSGGGGPRGPGGGGGGGGPGGRGGRVSGMSNIKSIQHCAPTGGG